MEQNQKAILSDSKEALKKTKGRVPNWMISFLIGAFLCLLGGVFYTMQQSEKYAYQKLAVEHWKQKYEECASETE